MKLTTEKKCILLCIIALFLFYMIKNKETIVDGMSSYMELKKADYLIAPQKKYIHEHTMLDNHYDDDSMYVRIHPGDKPASRWHNSAFDNLY